MVEIGSKVRDVVTGFQGVVLARTTWLYGCKRVLVASMSLHEGKPQEDVWLDVQRIEFVEQVMQPPAKASDAISLGAEVCDTISGYKGICVGRTETLAGQLEIGIEGSLKDNKPPEVVWFNAERVEMQKSKAPPVVEGHGAQTGGPQSDPQRSYSKR